MTIDLSTFGIMLLAAFVAGWVLSDLLLSWLSDWLRGPR